MIGVRFLGSIITFVLSPIVRPLRRYSLRAKVIGLLFTVSGLTFAVSLFNMRNMKRVNGEVSQLIKGQIDFEMLLGEINGSIQEVQNVLLGSSSTGEANLAKLTEIEGIISLLQQIAGNSTDPDVIAVRKEFEAYNEEVKKG